jgi:hypothetical protein
MGALVVHAVCFERLCPKSHTICTAMVNNMHVHSMMLLQQLQQPHAARRPRWLISITGAVLAAAHL